MFKFDNSPALFLGLGDLLLILTGFFSVYPLFQPQIAQRKRFIYLFVSLLIITLIMLRLPVIVYNEALNPDESVFIVGAMTLANDPIYWESVDGCTSGPLSFYIITIFCEILRQPYDYVSARIIGILLMAGSVIFSFLAIRKMFTESVAFLSIFPAVAFLSTTRYPDFVHFSSEHLPIFLLSLMSYLYALLSMQTVIKTRTVLLLGVIAGAVPFTKLQAIPIAAFLVFNIYWLLYDRDKKRFIQLASVLTLGGLLAPALLMLIAIYFGFLEKIWIYYIKNNLGYGGSVSMLSVIYSSLFDPVNIFIRIIALLSISLVLYYLFIKKSIKPSLQSFFIIAFLLGSLFSVYKTGFMFHHYLLFLIFPTTFLYASFLNSFIHFDNKIIVYGFANILMVVILIFTIIYPFTNQYITSGKQIRPIPLSPIGQEILKYTKPEEPIVIWGEGGKYYLETQRNQGVRWSHTLWGMYNDSLQRTFQKEYVKEFQESSSPVFIDTHPNEGSFMTRDKCGYETNPELKEFVNKNYEFVGEINQQRIYVRNDRLRTKSI